jgi:hypothetical protein
MPMPEDTTAAWSIDVRMLDEHNVELVYVGDAPASAVEVLHADLMRVLKGRQNVTGWLVDAVQAGAVSWAPTNTMYDVLKLWRAHGGRRFAVATNVGALKMMGSALRFAKVVPIQIFSSRAQAIAYLQAESPR